MKVGGGTDAEADPHGDEGDEHKVAVRRVIPAVRVVHLGRSTWHAISGRGISQLGFRTVE